MSIHPQYADAILEGCKRVEFRKRRLAPDVSTVLIYATSPVRRLVGQFSISAMVEAAPHELWNEFHHVGGISAGDFARYYDGSRTAVGIKVGAVQRFERPVALEELPNPPAVPQSFAYVDETLVREVIARSRPTPRAVHLRLWNLLSTLRAVRAAAAGTERRAS